MTGRIVLVCSALALCVGLSSVPAAYAADGDAMAKPPGGAMMQKDEMKKHKKKDTMMHSDTMMKKQETPPAQ